MLKRLAVLLLFVCGSTAAWADAAKDCVEKSGDVAIAACTETIRLNPKNAVAFHKRGTAYRLKDDNDRAIADYNEAVRLDPKYTDAFFNRAYVYNLGKGDYDRAIADYNETIRLDPQHFYALFTRGNLHSYAKGDYDRAIADYDRAMRLAPLDWLAAVHARRGNAHVGKKDFDRAIADYEAALKIDPKNAASLYARGVLKKRKGDASGDADMAAATAIQAGIAAQFFRGLRGKVN